MDYYKIMSEYFFSDWIMFVVTFIAFVVSIWHWNKNKQLRIITIYIIVAFLNDLICNYYGLFCSNEELKNYILDLSVKSFMIIEIIIFLVYLHTNISSNKMKMIIKIIFISFFLVIFIIQKITPQFYSSYYYSISWIVVWESLCLLIPCLSFFYELFTSPQITLKNHPPFWIVTGILFYNACSMPIFLLHDYLKKNLHVYYNIFFSLNYILYTILFSLFIIGYLCKKEVTSL